MNFRSAALQGFRLAVMVAVVWLVRAHHARLRAEGDRPVRVEEVRGWFTNAHRLRLDLGGQAGFIVYDLEGAVLGSVVRTLPHAEKFIGYCGVTDTLVALGPDQRVLGFSIRWSEDTKTHVADVLADRHFRKTWNGMNWDEVAAMDLKKAGVEGVSGATMTSLAMAEGVVHRFRMAEGEQSVRFGQRDAGLAVAVLIGGWLTFTKRPGRERWRRWFQWAVIGYVGLLNGDLIAQSLLAGWAKSGVAWRLAPGLVLFVAAALLVPWTTQRPVYCQQLCPHGALQEIIGRHAPQRWRWRVPASVERPLRWLPGGLLGFVLMVVMLPLDFDLAGLEPFDAYVIRAAGAATLAVALVGLLLAAFVPKAYCKYGCPTGALLEFLRARGGADSFCARDWAALGMLGLALFMRWQHATLHAWIFGAAA